MGTYLWSYAVDLGKLRAAYGSKSKSLARKATKGSDDNSEWFSDEIAAGAPTLERAIGELVDGKITAKKHAFQYVYAAQALCRALGTRVGDELKVGGWIEDVLDPHLKSVKAKDFCTLMHLHKPALPMPLPKSDIPFCSSMTPDEVAIALGAFARLAARFKAAPPADDGLDFVVKEMTDRLKGASKRRRGIVHFMY